MTTIAMFRKSYLLSIGIAAACLLTTPVYASPAKGKQVAQVKKKKKKAPADTAPAASSADVAPAPFANQETSAQARGSKPLSLFVNTSLVNLVHTGAGLELNYAVTPHEVLGVSVLRAQFAWLAYKDVYTFYTVNSRTFVGNSFYLLLGGGLRQTSFTTNYYGDPSGGTGTAPATAIVGQSDGNVFTAKHIIGEIGLGNRWQFGSGFTLGCDWVIYDHPFSEMSSEAQYGAVGQSQQQKDDNLNDAKRAMGLGTVTLTRFHIGWAF